MDFTTDYRNNNIVIFDLDGTLANIDKTKKDMLWIPTTSFEVGVERTVESLAKMMDKK